ncbi:MAG: hypothetical protein ALAOOOJD_04380 [bacterium]|nr:hypothetical protein [bacterium]
MRIEFKIEGGFVFLPGLNKPVTIDTEALPPPEAKELQRLLTKSRFFELPQRVSKFSAKAADYRQYKVMIENNDGSRHTVQLTDMVADPHLRKLLDFLKAQAAPQLKKT